MRLWILPVAALAGFALGCNKSPEGGTPGTDSNFKISLPTTPAALKSIKQGTSETYEASLDRGKEFKKDVNLKAEVPADSKLDVKLTKPTIKASESDTKFNIVVTAAKDSPVAEHTITVTGTPDAGSATSGTFKVKVTGP